MLRIQKSQSKERDREQPPGKVSNEVAHGAMLSVANVAKGNVLSSPRGYRASWSSLPEDWWTGSEHEFARAGIPRAKANTPVLSFSFWLRSGLYRSDQTLGSVRMLV